MLAKKNRSIVFVFIIILSFVLFGCADKINVQTTFEDPTPSGIHDRNSSTDKHVGFEVIQLQSRNSLRAWISNDISREEFSELNLPLGWFKNQPREAMVDGSRFYKSPFTETNGEFLIGEAFGFNWWHSATVIKTNISLDNENLLVASKVHKYHEIRFYAGSTLTILLSPTKEPYVLISRDADRKQESPTIPTNWKLIEYITPDDLVFMLPEEVLVIRTDNEDSFQGPVSELYGIF